MWVRRVVACEGCEVAGYVYVMVDWRKSSYSWSSGECIEVAGNAPAVIKVRDSKDPGGHVLAFDPVQWGAFVDDLRGGGHGLQ